MQFKFFRWLHKRGFSRRKMRGGFLHRWLGDHVYSKDLWRLKREPVARAWFWGCLTALSPFMGLHILLSAVLSMSFRANLPVTFALQWVTNPLTAPLYYPLAFALGCRVLNTSPDEMENWKKVLLDLLDPSVFFHSGDYMELMRLFIPLFIGCLLIGLVVGGIGYFVIQFGWPERPVKKPAPPAA